LYFINVFLRWRWTFFVLLSRVHTMLNGVDRHGWTNVYDTLCTKFAETCRAESNATRIKSVRIKLNQIDNSSVDVSMHVSLADVITYLYLKLMKFKNLQLPKKRSVTARRWLIKITCVNEVSFLMIFSAVILNIFSKSELLNSKKIWKNKSNLYSRFNWSTSSSNESVINSSLLYFFLPWTRPDVKQNPLGR